jgi:ppGpp synthetase/RelA/SpoT-type nucleotidyltranferase
MKVIDAFLAQYRKEFDFFDQAARLVYQQLESHLQASGIRAIVTSRAKKPLSLERKLRQRSLSKKKQYKSLDEVYADIVDLAGVRVALYFPSDRDEIDKIISKLFLLTEPRKDFPLSSPHSKDKRFSGYWATHYRVRLREDFHSDPSKRYCAARVEIQVASVLMHAWAEVEHDLVYKPAQGKLSEDEYAILDELNGLVLAGEIALERLQRAVKARVGRLELPFSNHYELAAYLSEAAKNLLKSPVADAALGQVSLLFTFLKNSSHLTPKSIAPFISSLHANTDKRPIAEQIIDQILAINPTLYKVYSRTREEHRRLSSLTHTSIVAPPSETAQAMGHFLSNWIPIERLIAHLARKRGVSRLLLPMSDESLRVLGIRSKPIRAEIGRLRRLRSQMVHGHDDLDSAMIVHGLARLNALTKRLSRNSKFKSLLRKVR